MENVHRSMEERACVLFASAQRALGTLTEGERVDLLLDSIDELSGTVDAHLIIDGMVRDGDDLLCSDCAAKREGPV